MGKHSAHMPQHPDLALTGLEPRITHLGSFSE